MLKHIGILSMQRVLNYGSFLQAYALKQLLLRFGAESVEFIDIIPGKALPGYSQSKISFLLSKLIKRARIILGGKMMTKIKLRRHRRDMTSMMKEAWKELGLTDSFMAPSVDLAVIGSDEVFNCCQKTSWGFSPQLFGKVENAREVVSYAASFGATDINAIKASGVEKEIATNLRNMKCISVRDANSKYIIEQLTGLSPHLNIDPVLAFGFTERIASGTKVDESNYILLYAYPERIKDKKEIEAIRHFARSTGKKLICPTASYEWCDRNIIPTPFELLDWFRNADMVISETFHGIILSLITDRQFVAIVRDSAINKSVFLLQSLGLENRMVSPERDINEIFADHIDFDILSRRIDTMREENNKYFKMILQRLLN